MDTTIPKRRLERPDSEDNFPIDFDPQACPILAAHYFGLELRDVREVFWSRARQGYPPAAEPGVILLAGGRS